MKRVSDISLDITPDGWPRMLDALSAAERAGYEVEFDRDGICLILRTFDDRPLAQIPRDAERFADAIASALTTPATAPATPEPGNGAVKEQVAPEGTVANGVGS